MSKSSMFPAGLPQRVQVRCCSISNATLQKYKFQLTQTWSQLHVAGTTAASTPAVRPWSGIASLPVSLHVLWTANQLSKSAGT